MKAKLCLKNLFIVSTLILIAFAASSCTVNADPPVYYTITAAGEIENGTVSVDKTSATSGETVKITATADDTYELSALNVTDENGNKIPVTDGSFTMPESNVTVSAVFKNVYTITISDGIENGTVVADKATAKSDETVTLTLTAADGYEIDTISVNDASNNDIATTTVTAGEAYTFVMPESNVTVSVVFKKVYTITVSDEIANGIVTADKTTAKIDETVTLTLTAADDYEIDTISVKDASNNDIATTTVTAGETYTFVMPESNVVISASFKELPNYTITVSDEIANGIVTADKTTAKRGKTVILTLAASDGYEFDSISVKDACNNDIATTTVTARETYTFVMPEGNVTVNAVFKKIYTITVSDGIANGTVMADKTTAKKDETVTLTLSANSGYKLDTLSVKDTTNNVVATTAVTAGTKYTFVMPEDNVTVSAEFDYKFNETMTVLPAGTDGTAAGARWIYVNFGDWPQTIKADSVTVDETKSVMMGDFTYYKGSDGAWYAKCTENAYGTRYKYSDGTDVAQASANSTKYFKVEPIKWRVLTDNYNGKKLLLAENILAAHRYAESSNNYKDSEIREWLNGTFLGTAFSESARNQITTTTVDNSARSTNLNASPTAFNNGENKYACENTSDKIFLLSEQEVTTSAYGFAAYNVYKGDSNGTTKSSRIRMTTDFAKASGAEQSTTAGCGGPWWLRSPDHDSRLYAWYVPKFGAANCGSNVKYKQGVVPALCIEN